MICKSKNVNYFLFRRQAFENVHYNLSVIKCYFLLSRSRNFQAIIIRSQVFAILHLNYCSEWYCCILLFDDDKRKERKCLAKTSNIELHTAVVKNGESPGDLCNFTSQNGMILLFFVFLLIHFNCTVWKIIDLWNNLTPPTVAELFFFLGKINAGEDIFRILKFDYRKKEAVFFF